jgi:hypothetical protein
MVYNCWLQTNEREDYLQRTGKASDLFNCKLMTFAWMVLGKPLKVLGEIRQKLGFNILHTAHHFYTILLSTSCRAIQRVLP